MLPLGNHILCQYDKRRMVLIPSPQMHIFQFKIGFLPNVDITFLPSKIYIFSYFFIYCTILYAN